MLWVHLSVALLFVALGIVFWRGKGAAMIAGYNTAPEEEKMRTDEKKLCRFMAKLMFALAACWLVAALSEPLHSRTLLWSGLVLFLAVVIAGVIYANTGRRFDAE
ncbi:MAG: DUF3784 domain-containing protein [Clostridia bacterium]|nr:DUF3784 domain-containing protein [Clostridia bacterium]